MSVLNAVPFTSTIAIDGACLQLAMFPISFSPASGKYPFSFLLVYFSKKKRVLCASLLLKSNLGINFFWILGYSSTFRLFTRTGSYESKKVSDRFPDERVSIAQLYPDIHTLFSDARLGLQCIVSSYSALSRSVLSQFSFVSLTFDYLEFTGASTFTMHTYRRG